MPRSPSPARNLAKTKTGGKPKNGGEVRPLDKDGGSEATVVAAAGKRAVKAATPRTVAAEARSPRESARSTGASRHATRRPRVREEDDLDGGEGGDRQFVTALARGLDVLAAFRPGEGRLGNQELAERTGLPKPTVSRITHTLTQLGYLNYNQRLSQYELGGATLSLGYAALSNLDVRRIARPFMQELANSTNMTAALGLRDKLMILNVEAAMSQALIGLRLYAGSRVPLATTAMGRAYLAVIGEAERETLLDEIRDRHGDEWPGMRRAIDRAIRDMEENGFCLSIGDWQKDINGAGAAIPLPDGLGIYAIGIAGPAYLASPDYVSAEAGPQLADAARKIVAQLGGDQPARGARK
ncbi:Pca regulon regulatory protein [bacterium YEK0313]|nr:Pca regulon regulatory protein [bacterium YEK0313]